MLETICGGCVSSRANFSDDESVQRRYSYLSLRQVNHISSHVNTIDTLDTPAFLMLG